MDIRLIETTSPEYEQMKELRWTVLLNPINVPASYIDPEREKNDLLVAAFEGEQMIGCCILSKRDEKKLQVRQMAVDTKSQGTGVGTAIIVYCEEVAKERGFEVLMMHSRDVVIPFYEKCGYTIVSDQFFEVGIAHHVMEKVLGD